jgi:hypothetical protein
MVVTVLTGGGSSIIATAIARSHKKDSAWIYSILSSIINEEYNVSEKQAIRDPLLESSFTKNKPTTYEAATELQNIASFAIPYVWAVSSDHAKPEVGALRILKMLLVLFQQEMEDTLLRISQKCAENIQRRC